MNSTLPDYDAAALEWQQARDVTSVSFLLNSGFQPVVMMMRYSLQDLGGAQPAIFRVFRVFRGFAPPASHRVMMMMMSY